MTGKRHKKKVRPLLLAAKLISNIFHPAYYPMVFLTVLFFCTFLEYTSWTNFLVIIILTTLFTIIIPSAFIVSYRTAFRISRLSRMHRHGRVVPYLVHLVCYFFLLHLLQLIHAHGLVLDVIIVSILIQVCCTLVNFFWKVSLHAAGAGAIIGFLLINGTRFGLQPIQPLIVAILTCGIVGSSRLILRRNSLAQVNVGAMLGILCGVAGTLLSSFRDIL